MVLGKFSATKNDYMSIMHFNPDDIPILLPHHETNLWELEFDRWSPQVEEGVIMAISNEGSSILKGEILNWTK